MDILIDLDRASGLDLFRESQDYLIKRIDDLCVEHKMEYIIVSTSVFNYISSNDSFQNNPQVFTSKSPTYDMFGNEIQSIGTIHGIPVVINIEFARDKILLSMDSTSVRDRTIDKLINDIDFIREININLKGVLF